MAPQRTHPTSRRAHKEGEMKAGDQQPHKPIRPPSPLPTPRTSNLHEAPQRNEEDYVEVELTMHAHQCEGQTAWAVVCRPDNQIYVGMKIKLTSANNTIGSGRVSAVSNLCRHWVAFRLLETKTTNTLHVPIPWAKLPDFESYTHTKHYFQLPTHPLAHIQFRYNPVFYDKTQNPYEFDLWSVDTDKLDKRMEEIGRGRRGARQREGEKRGANQK